MYDVPLLAFLVTETSISQKDIAKELGVTQASVSIWTTGKKVIPDKYHDKLVEIFHINKKWFENVFLSNAEQIELKMELFGETPELQEEYREYHLIESMIAFINSNPDEKETKIYLLEMLMGRR